MNGSVKIYSRIGELIQGILPDQGAFLISGLPSRTLYSEAILQDGPGVDVLPAKVSQALSLFLSSLEQRIDPLAGKSLRLSSNIPPGKGLSSSSADILSVLYVVNDYLQTGFTPEELYLIAVRVEPTDPCLSSDIVLFRQQTGVIERVLLLPPLTLLYFDAAPDRQINTVGVERSYPAEASGFFGELLRKFVQAAAEKDYEGIFDCITQSAVCNQAVIPLPRFNEYRELAAGGAAGLMVAHSGTIIGLLTRPRQADELRERLERMANRYQPTLVHLENYSYQTATAYA